MAGSRRWGEVLRVVHGEGQRLIYSAIGGCAVKKKRAADVKGKLGRCPPSAAKVIGS